MAPQVILKVAGLIRGSCVGEEADYSDDLYVDINQASEMTCCSTEFFTAFFHLDFLRQQGHLLNLSDQIRKKFSLHRPFEGGYEPPQEFTWSIYKP